MSATVAIILVFSAVLSGALGRDQGEPMPLVSVAMDAESADCVGGHRNSMGTRYTRTPFRVDLSRMARSVVEVIALSDYQHTSTTSNSSNCGTPA